MDELPSSLACLRNRDPILNILKKYINKKDKILEIGHGTGEHAVYFASQLDCLWYPADQPSYNWIMEERAKLFELENLKKVISLVVGEIELKEQIKSKFSGVFSANTLHIMSEELAYKLCDEVTDLLESNGHLYFYGPFKFDGKFTSESNEQFDYSLRARGEGSGIRDFEKFEEILARNKIKLIERYDLPANNQLLIFRKNES